MIKGNAIEGGIDANVWRTPNGVVGGDVASVPLEAGVGVPNNRAKRKHNPNSAPSINKRCKRRVTESQSEVIAAINRLREARQARDPG